MAEKKELTTYEEVAEACGLTGETKRRYLAYMTTRWKDSENVKCRVGYAEEWAERFLGGYEYQASDFIGQSILKTL